MSSGPKVIVYPVNDIDQAKTFYEALLGNAPEIDTPYYVQFNIGDQILGLDPNGHSRGFQGAVCYWEVEDVERRFSELLSAGAAEHEAPRDVGSGNLIASVRDADGNIIGFAQADQNQ
jgi:predicted enzyme related to lactoylglutathione lyase